MTRTVVLGAATDEQRQTYELVLAAQRAGIEAARGKYVLMGDADDSYDFLENMFGLGIHSADKIVSEWQTRSIGDLVFADSKGTGGWYVSQVVPGEALVLDTADLKRGRPCSDDVNAFIEQRSVERDKRFDHLRRSIDRSGGRLTVRWECYCGHQGAHHRGDALAEIRMGDTDDRAFGHAGLSQGNRPDQEGTARAGGLKGWRYRRAPWVVPRLAWCFCRLSRQESTPRSH